MNIAILGYGKMGKKIAVLAEKMGHTIVSTSNSKNPARSLNLSVIDVCIDFSNPKTAFENIVHAIKLGKPIVSGTTGWLKKLPEVELICRKYNGSFLYSENFSIGMNIFLEINKKLAKIMENNKYECNIHEIHHKNKLDAPSGTAKKLGEEICNILGYTPNITYERKNNIIGNHTITYKSKSDVIKIEHLAKDRESFAYGALLGAKWILNKKGVFTFKDVLESNNNNI